MKKIVFALTMLVVCAAAMAQTPKTVLDRTATVISNPGGITATFKMTGGMGNASGTIAVKGKKFQACSPVATIWFNGKTMWTYMKKNDEVNVTNPSDAELQKINPYNFINLYKKGYDMNMSSAGSTHTVHLTAQSSQKIQEMFITVDKKSFHPTQVKMLQGRRWTTFEISELKTTTLNDSMFTFNSKDFPSAEVIDLR
jgi:outer membrane lipoprotein-sorting protein